MAPHAAVADSPLNLADQTKVRTDELNPVRLRQRIERLLHKIFEGREEYLGWTPD